MPFVQAKCTECGGMLAVDNSKKAAICQFCGNAFIVEEAVNNYITNNITNNNFGEGAIVNIYADTTKDFEIEAGVLKKYRGESPNVVIPNNVFKIGNNCFYMTNIKSVVIPNSVTEIGYGAFSACSNLTSLTIPNSVTKIDDCAFSNCNNLASITIPNSVKRIAPHMLSSCQRLSSVTIPSGVTEIGKEAFWWCDNLVSVKIPRSVTRIGERAFYRCEKLKSVVFESASMEASFLHHFEGTPYHKNKIAEIAEKKRVETERQVNELARKRTQYRSHGLCQHCGGIFNGFLVKKCSNCGRKKDY